MLYNKLSHETFTCGPLNKIHNVKRRKHVRGKKSKIRVMLFSQSEFHGPMETEASQRLTQSCFHCGHCWAGPGFSALSSYVYATFVVLAKSPPQSCLRSYHQCAGHKPPAHQAPLPTLPGAACPLQPPLEPGEIMTRQTE